MRDLLDAARSEGGWPGFAAAFASFMTLVIALLALVVIGWGTLA